MTPEILEDAFWAAGERLNSSPDALSEFGIHTMDIPYFDSKMDMIDTSGGGMPGGFWKIYQEEIEKRIQK